MTHELTTSSPTVTVSTDVDVTTGAVTDRFKGVVKASGTVVFSSDASTASLNHAKANWKDLRYWKDLKNKNS